MRFRKPKALYLATALLSTAALFLPVNTSFGQEDIATTREELLAKSDELIKLMTPQQRLEYIRAEELVKSGESDIRRGQFMIDREPSRLNPDEDLREEKARGKELLRKGRIDMRKGEQEILLLLRKVESERLSNQKPEQEVYKMAVSPSQTYDNALESAGRSVIKFCWEKGYNRIFYDRVYFIDNEGTKTADPKIRNLTYDTLIRIDGTRFSIVMPVDLSLDIKSKPGSRKLNFENRDSFASERIALLSIQVLSFDDEFFGPIDSFSDDVDSPAGEMDESASGQEMADMAGGPDADEASDESSVEETDAPASPIQLLVFQAIDADTLQLIDQELRWIVSKTSAIPRSAIKDRLNLTERKQTIQLLESLPEPYRFRIFTEQADPIRAAMFESYLLDVLSDNFDLQLVPLLSLQRLLSNQEGEDEEEEEEPSTPDFRSLSTAMLSLEANSENPSKLNLIATADSSDRKIPLGWIEISKD